MEPLQANVGKRLVKSPKVYVRDSGLTHALLRLSTLDDLQGHPIVGPSWEGFVIETLLAAAPGAAAYFYRTAAGAEVDLVLDHGGGPGRWVVEIKRGLVTKGLLNAVADVQPSHCFVVYSGTESYPLGASIGAIGLPQLAARLSATR